MGYYRRYLRALKSACKKDLRIVEIGRVNRLPVYKIVLNPSGERTVAFSAGMHGDEIAGPWAVIEFLKRYDPRDYPGIRIVLFPVASPTAFDRKRRYNYLDRELNLSFLKKRPPEEDRILARAAKDEKVFFFHALHEDTRSGSFYLFNFEKKKERIYRSLVKLAARHFPVNRSRRILRDPAVNGIVINREDGSFEHWMYCRGTPYSMCTETPGRRPLGRRIALSVALMNKVLDFSSP